MKLGTSGIAAVVIFASGVLTAPAGAAERMVGKCADGRNLCAADPATGAVTPLTTDGATTSYGSPEVSTDGTVLGFLRNGAPVRGGPDPASATVVFETEQDVQSWAMSPDGQGVSARTSGVTGGTFVSRLYVTAPDHAAWFEESSSYVHDTGWLGREALNSSPSSNQTICVFRQGMSCVRPVATVPGASIVTSPVGSPDGSRLVLTAAGDGTNVVRTVLVDPATAAPIRDLSSGPTDSSPSWSPDGTMVSFSRDGSTWAVPADGSAPPRLIVSGLTGAAWGRDSTRATPPPGGGGPGALGRASLRTRTVRAGRTGRIRLRLRCPASGACRAERWTVSLRGRRVATLRVPALAAGASRTVTAKLSARARRALRRSRTKRLVLRVKRPGRPALKLTVRRSSRR